MLLVACGGGGGSSPSPSAPAVPKMEAFVSVIARALATDPAGNLYAAGTAVTAPNTGTPAILSISRSGLVTQLPGTWSLSGTQSIAADRSSTVYVGDASFAGPRISFIPPAALQKITTDGTISTVPIKTSSDKSFDPVFPQTLAGNATNGLAIDAQGNFYFAERDGERIFRLSADGDLTTLAGEFGVDGEVDGIGRGARFA